MNFVLRKSNNMQTLQQSYNPSYAPTAKRQSVIVQYFAWCKGQEEYRFGWLAVILAVHGCVLSPATTLMIALGGNNIILWSMALGAMAMALVTNVSAMPTKITIPVFFFSILIDLVVIGVSLNAVFSS